MQQYISFQCVTIFGSRFSTSWGWKTVMRASVLTALLLSFCPTISVTSSGLSSKWLMSDWHSPRMALMIHTHIFFFFPRNTALTVHYISQSALKCDTSDEAECWGLGLIPHLLRIVLASRWYSRTSEKRIALFPRTHTVKALLLESGFSTFTTWKDGSRVETQMIISMKRFEFQQCSCQSGKAVVRWLYLSHWNNDMALAPILAGETQVVLRQAYLPKCVKMAEGHPQEAFMHFQQVFLFGKPEKCPELLALCMSF